MTLLETIIIAIVEGLTEFLPVSSTGHMIITQNLLGVTERMQDDPTMAAFVHAFTFIIQFGAILSVVCLYWKQYFQFDNTTVFNNERTGTAGKHFYRDLNNKMVAGVLSGFALYTNTNVLFWRLGTV
jgi:undecaprenyl-diphosphatase